MAQTNFTSNPTPDGLPLTSLPPSPRRLPTTTGTQAPKPPSVWTFLKDTIGKDLSRISLPVSFNEPLSFLQRLAEDLEYSHLLDEAAKHPAYSADRLALICAFIISHYSSTHERVTKPFNPLLNETFDFIDHSRGFALLAEQVSHHPPTSALHCCGRGWSYDLTHEIRSRFLGNSLEVWPHGDVHIRFEDGGHYVYEQARSFVNNIVVGELWLENGGEVLVREVERGELSGSIKFKRKGIFGGAKRFGDVSGKVFIEDGGQVVKVMKGNWREEVKVDSRIVWTAVPRPGLEFTGGYAMSSWGWCLNAKEEEEGQCGLARSDCRLRPDQRMLDEGDVEGATKEKERLEEAQRRRRKSGEGEARWFCEDGKDWRYVGGYFKSKIEGFGDDVPSIFS